jgi:hypothetical protein
MKVNHKAKMKGYNNHVWFSEYAITNIIALKSLIKQYQVTYDSNNHMFIVHREQQNKPNMEFKMHESGLHCFDPRDKACFVFLNTVSGNKEGFSQRQVKDTERAKTLYAKLGYLSIKDFKCLIQSNQIQDCPVTVQDVDVAHKIYGARTLLHQKGRPHERKQFMWQRIL